MPYYLNKSNVGVSIVSSEGDGSTIKIKWHRAYPTNNSNLIAYNIYMDTVMPDFETEFFNKSPMFVSVDGKLSAEILGLTPGQMYRIAVRPVEYNPSTFDLRSFPSTSMGTLRVYPESALREDITETSSIIPLLDIENFPSTGVVKIGVELIQYTSLDAVNNDLVLTNVSLQRGFNGTTPSIHNTDGYDGYVVWDSQVMLFPVDFEDQNTVVFATQSRFDINNYAFNLEDGYRQILKDIVNSDLSPSDEANEDFPIYDNSGWNRIDPVALLNGDCVGSYFGGQLYCADGYNGVGVQLRGISAQDLNTQRQEQLLSMIGEPVVLMKRSWTGITCKCLLATSESPDARCLYCYGVGIVLGYSEYFSNRNSDGRIRMKFDPWLEDLALTDSGLEPESTKPNAWTLVLPAIKKRDFIIRFDQDGNEEFRYEVTGVTRNTTFTTTTGSVSMGAQKLNLQRVRKSDIIYMVPYYKSFDGKMPTTINTSISSSLGIPPHSHTIITNEKSPVTWGQLTSVSAGHNHRLSWDPMDGTLKISTELSHNHNLIY